MISFLHSSEACIAPVSAASHSRGYNSLLSPDICAATSPTLAYSLKIHFRDDSAVNENDRIKAPITGTVNALLNPLWCAVAISNLQLIEWLIIDIGLSPFSCVDAAGRNILHVAAEDGQRCVCEALLLATAGYRFRVDDEMETAIPTLPECETSKHETYVPGLDKALWLLRLEDLRGMTPRQVAADSTTSEVLWKLESWFLRDPLLKCRIFFKQ